MQILVQQAVGGAWEYAFLTSSQVVHLPSFKKQIIKRHNQGHRAKNGGTKI